jgi:hypothetical protein
VFVALFVGVFEKWIRLESTHRIYAIINLEIWNGSDEGIDFILVAKLDLVSSDTKAGCDGLEVFSVVAEDVNVDTFLDEASGSGTTVEVNALRHWYLY